jgi:hypothetical protein
MTNEHTYNCPDENELIHVEGKGMIPCKDIQVGDVVLLFDRGAVRRGLITANDEE